MSHAFGRSITHRVRAFAGDTPVAIAELLSARIYRDAPTEVQKRDSDASEGGFDGRPKTQFSATDAANLVYTVTFDPIDDPKQQSGSLYEVYHPVVNVLLEAGGQEQALYKPIVIWRVVPQFEQLDVEPAGLYAIEGEIEHVLGATVATQKINLARDRVLAQIKARGLDRHRLSELDLGEAVLYKAAQLALIDMATDRNNYGSKADRYGKMFAEIWGELKPGYDRNDDGLVEPYEQATTIRGIAVRM